MQTENFTDEIEGFVLAGGKSSRMGTDKAFLTLNEETFLERAVKILSAVCGSERVKIVLNQHQSVEDFISFDYVRDVFLERGALGGIHAALSNTKSEWTVIIACDLPLITVEILSELMKIACSAPKDIAAIVPKESNGKIQPLCALYRARLCLPPLKQLLQSPNSVSVRDFLEGVQTFYIEYEKTPARNESVFFNVNTTADYALLTKK